MNTAPEGLPGKTAAGIALAHGVLAVSLPALFLAGALSLISDVAGFIVFSDPLYALSLLAGGIAAVSLNALFRTLRGGSLARQRTLLLSLLFLYLLRFPFARGTLFERALPSWRFMVIEILFAAEWVWAGGIFRFLSDRGELIADLGARGAQTIHHAVHDDESLLVDAMEGIARVQGLIGTLTIALLALCAFPLLWGRVPSTRSLVMVGLFIAYREFAESLFRHYREEFSLAALGLSGAFSYGRDRAIPSIAIILTAVAVSAAAASPRALVPTGWLFRLIARFFAYLGTIGSREQSFPASYPETDLRGEPMAQMAMPEGVEPLFDPTVLFAILKYVALGALGVGILWFLFGPFFTRAFRTFFAEGNLGRYVRLLIATLRNGFLELGRCIAQASRTLFGFRGAGRPPTRGKEGERFEALLKERAETSKSPEKREEIGRLTARFAELIDLGAERGCPWEPHEAPMEYALRLDRALGAKNGDIPEAGRLFEKALYARELLSCREEEAFFGAVDRVITREAGAPGTK